MQNVVEIVHALEFNLACNVLSRALAFLKYRLSKKSTRSSESLQNSRALCRIHRTVDMSISNQFSLENLQFVSKNC